MTKTKSLATQVLDLMAEVTEDTGAAAPVRFEELTADPGELPRFMLTLRESNDEQRRYVSGERVIPFPFALTLRMAGDDEQSRLDAAETLCSVADAFLARCVLMDGFVACEVPQAGVPVCLGKSDAGFEDWQVTFTLRYMQTR